MLIIVDVDKTVRGRTAVELLKALLSNPSLTDEALANVEQEAVDRADKLINILSGNNNEPVKKRGVLGRPDGL